MNVEVNKFNKIYIIRPMNVGYLEYEKIYNFMGIVVYQHIRLHKFALLYSNILAGQHISILIYQYYSISVYCCMSIFVYQYVSISVYQYCSISVYQYIGTSVYQYIHISVDQYIGISNFQDINISVYQYVNKYRYIQTYMEDDDQKVRTKIRTPIQQ